MVGMKDSKKGFVILIAVLVATLVVSIGAFIASIAVKELRLSSSGRESQNAFYAADSAIECALYHDLRVEAFGSSPSVPVPIYCNGQDDIVLSNQFGDTTNSESFFEIFFVEDGKTQDESPYARVKVTKSNVGTISDRTVIEAQGYNIRDINSTVRVERALQVVY